MNVDNRAPELQRDSRENEPETTDIQFEDDVDDFFAPRVKAAGPEDRAWAGLNRRAKDRLSELSDSERVDTMPESLVAEGVMMAAGRSEYLRMQIEEEEDADLRATMERTADMGDTVFRATMEKLAGTAIEGIRKRGVAESLNLVQKMVSRTESGVFNGKSESLRMGIEVLSEGGIERMMKEDPEKLQRDLGDIYNVLVSNLEDTVEDVEQDRLAGDITQADHLLRQKDMAKMNRAIYRLLRTRDFVAERVAEVSESSSKKGEGEDRDEAILEATRELGVEESSMSFKEAQAALTELPRTATLSEFEAVYTPEVKRAVLDEMLADIDRRIAAGKTMNKRDGSVVASHVVGHVFGMNPGHKRHIQIPLSIERGAVVDPEEILGMNPVQYMKEAFGYDLTKDEARIKDLREYTSMFMRNI